MPFIFAASCGALGAPVGERLQTFLSNGDCLSKTCVSDVLNYTAKPVPRQGVKHKYYKGFTQVLHYAKRVCFLLPNVAVELAAVGVGSAAAVESAAVNPAVVCCRSAAGEYPPLSALIVSDPLAPRCPV